MSKIEVDAIEPQSGTTLTIGASGDTVAFSKWCNFLVQVWVKFCKLLVLQLTLI
jgi:hypothetical protein